MRAYFAKTISGANLLLNYSSRRTLAGQPIVSSLEFLILNYIFNVYIIHYE